MTPTEKCKLCQGYGLVQQFGAKPPAEWVPCPAGCPQPTLHQLPLYTGPAPWSGLTETITKSAGSFIFDGWVVGQTIRIMSAKKGVQFWAQNRRTSKYAAKRWAYLVRHGLAYTTGVVTAVADETVVIR